MSQSKQSGWESYGNWAEGKSLDAGPWFLGLYQPAPESKPFWDGVAEHRLLLPRCKSCGYTHHPRRIVCTMCNGSDFQWIAASGRGSLFSFSEIHRAVSPIAGKPPYTIGIVRLDEGVHMISRIYAGGTLPIAIGAPVRVEFRRLEAGFDLPVYVTDADPKAGPA